MPPRPTLGVGDNEMKRNGGKGPIMGSFPAATRYQLQNYRWRWAPVLAGRKWVANSNLDKHGAIMGPDPALFFSFYPSVFDSSITYLQDSLQKISSWMTANLLTLNSSKTEFLLVGLPQQLAKINTSSVSLITTNSARNLGFIFDEHPTFSDQNICSL